MLFPDKTFEYLKKITLLLLMLSSSMALAEKRQIGNTVIDVPEGWRFYVNRQGLGNLNKPYSKGKKPCDFCEFYIYKGSEKTGDFDAWVKEKQMLARGDKKLFNDKIVTKEALITGGRIRVIMSVIKDGRDIKIQCIYAMERKKTYEMVFFEGDAKTPKQREDAMKMANEFALKLLSSFKYVSEGEKPVMGTPKPGSYQGVYHGRSWSSGMSTSSGVPMTTVSKSVKLITFFKSGYYVDGIPEQGMSSFDPKFYKSNKPAEIGIYEAKGNKMHLMDATGKKWDMDIDGQILEFGDMNIRKAKIPKNGLRFTGHIRNESFSSMLGVNSSGSNTIEFFADGRYQSSSFSSTTSPNVAASKKDNMKLKMGF